MTLVWLVVWFICDRIGDREGLTFNPVDWWAGTLLLTIALDLGRHRGVKVRSPVTFRR